MENVRGYGKATIVTDSYIQKDITEKESARGSGSFITEMDN